MMTTQKHFETAKNYLEQEGYVVSTAPNCRSKLFPNAFYVRNPEGQPCNLAPMSPEGVIALATFYLSQDPVLLPEQAAIVRDAASKKLDDICLGEHHIVEAAFRAADVRSNGVTFTESYTPYGPTSCLWTLWALNENGIASVWDIVEIEDDNPAASFKDDDK